MKVGQARLASLQESLEASNFYRICFLSNFSMFLSNYILFWNLKSAKVVSCCLRVLCCGDRLCQV